MYEYQYSSIMDYGAEFNSDLKGLGLYDKALIKFSYGELLEVLTDAKPDSLETIGALHAGQNSYGLPSPLRPSAVHIHQCRLCPRPRHAHEAQCFTKGNVNRRTAWLPAIQMAGTAPVERVVAVTPLVPDRACPEHRRDRCTAGGLRRALVVHQALQFPLVGQGPAAARRLGGLRGDDRIHGGLRDRVVPRPRLRVHAPRLDDVDDLLRRVRDRLFCLRLEGDEVRSGRRWNRRGKRSP